MSGVHFTDGFDRPDTIALGLDAPRLVTVVVAALSAYAVMQAPLPFALRVCVAVLLGGVGATLGWGRFAGRPLLAWAWLALRFTLAPRSGGRAIPVADVVAAPQTVAPAPEVAPVATAVADVREAAPVARAVPEWAQWLEPDEDDTAPAAATPVIDLPPAAEERVPVAGPGEPACPPESMPFDVVETPRSGPLVVVMNAPPAAGGDEDATVAEDVPPPAVVELPRTAPPHAAVVDFPIARGATAATHPVDPATAPVFVGAPRRIAFFSLKGGAGRTTLATEVACILAARGRHLAADGSVRPLDVALLDLDLRSATVAVRLGIAQPTLSDYLARGGDPSQLDACMVRHGTGLRVLLGPPKPVASGPAALEPARVAEIVHRLERDGAHFVVIDVAADLGAVTTWVLSAAHDVFVVITPTAGGVQDAYRTTESLRRLGLGHKLRYVVNRARGGVDLDEVMGDLGGRIAAVIPYDPAVEDAENHHRIAGLDTTGPAALALHELAAQIYPALAPASRRARLGWLPWRRRVG